MDLLDALAQQQQCDEEGVMCIVSRQAVDEAIVEIKRLRKLADRQTNVIIKQDDENDRLREAAEYWRDLHNKAAQSTA